MWPNDDHPLGIDDDGLAKAELADRLGHGIDRGIVLAGVARVGLDVGDFPYFDLHRRHLEHRVMCWWLRATECGVRQSRAAGRRTSGTACR